MRTRILPLLAALACACAATPTSPDSWSMRARLVESCCCAPICPCIVGSSPTLGYCHGNRLVEIVDAHCDGVDLDGVDVIITFRVGEWTKLWFDDDATEQQVAAAVELLKHQRSFLFGERLEVARVPLSIERTASHVAFSCPSTETVIELLRGVEDKTVEVVNLDLLRDYLQHRSLTVSRDAEDETRSFAHEGTNGFTADYRNASE
jgi:hypothetical protein